jgi:hypothetical protein
MRDIVSAAASVNLDTPAAQALPAPVARVCREINALVIKLEQSERKADDYKRTIGQLIKTIKAARPNDWEDIVRAECNLGRRSAYDYMAISDGTLTVEDQGSANRERVARHRALRNAHNDAIAHELEGFKNEIAEPEVPFDATTASTTNRHAYKLNSTAEAAVSRFIYKLIGEIDPEFARELRRVHRLGGTTHLVIELGAVFELEERGAKLAPSDPAAGRGEVAHA